MFYSSAKVYSITVWFSFWKTFDGLNYVNRLVFRYCLDKSGKLCCFGREDIFPKRKLGENVVRRTFNNPE